MRFAIRFFVCSPLAFLGYGLGLMAGAWFLRPFHNDIAVFCGGWTLVVFVGGWFAGSVDTLTEKPNGKE